MVAYNQPTVSYQYITVLQWGGHETVYNTDGSVSSTVPWTWEYCTGLGERQFFGMQDSGSSRIPLVQSAQFDNNRDGTSYLICYFVQV